MKAFNVLHDMTDSMISILNTMSLEEFDNIKISRNNDLFFISEMLSDYGQEINHKVDEKEKIRLILEQFKKSLDTKDVRERFNILLKYSSRINKAITKSINDSKKLNSVVNELIENINQNFNERIKRNSFLMVSEESIKPNVDRLSIFEWNGIDSDNTEDKIASSVETFLGITEPLLSKTNFSIVVDRLKSTKFLSKVYNETKILDNDAPIVIKDMMIDEKSFVLYFSKLSKKLGDVKNINKNIVDVCNSVTMTKDALLGLDQSKNNVKPLVELFNMVLFGCLYHKKKTFNSKVLINKSIVNGPVFYEEERNGLTLDNLASYVALLDFKDRDTPMNGVGIEEIKSSINDKLSELRSDIRKKQKEINTKFLKASFESVMKDNFDKIYEVCNEIRPIDKDRVTNDYNKQLERVRNRINGSTGIAEKYIYEIALETLLKDTLVEKTYTNMMSYIQDGIDKNKDLDDKDISIMKLKVYSDILFEHFTNTIL